MFNRYPGQSYRPSAQTVAGVRANVTQDFAGPGFTTYDVRDLARLDHQQHPEPYYVIIRNDMQQLVKDLVRQCFTMEGATTWAKFAKEVVINGVRYICESWTADDWIDAQEKLNDGRPIIWLVLWSDGTFYDTNMRQKEHMVTLSVANTCIEYQSKTGWEDGGQRVLALLPKVEQFEEENDSDFQKRQGLVLQWAMKKVLEQLVDMCTSGRLLHVTWPDGSEDNCHVRPLVYIADLLEQCALLSLKSAGTGLPDIQQIIAKEQLANFSTPMSSYPVRTTQLHKQALDQYNRTDAASRDAGERLLHELSMKPAPFVALWDLFPNVYEAFPPDVLHQDHLGITQHILQVVNKTLTTDKTLTKHSKRLKKTVNKRLQQMLPLHEADYPSQGLDATKMRGDEAKSLLKFLAPALYGVLPDSTVKVIAEYACYAHLRDAHTHTTLPRSAGGGPSLLGGSLLQLATDIDRVGAALSSVFVAADKAPTFPKMHNTRKYPGAILRFGNVQHANTAGREGAIKPLRQCWEHTNKQPRTLGQQVAKQVQLSEDLVAASRNTAANPPHNRVGTGVRQRAAATGAPAVAGTGMVLNCSQLEVSGSPESELAKAIPQLLHLPAALRQRFGVSPESAAVEIKATLGLPRPGWGADALHSHPAFFDRKHYNQTLDDVAYQGALRSRQGDDVVGVYYAQVIAVGMVNEQSFVFCQGYASSGTINSTLKLQPLVWESPPHANKRPKTGVVTGTFMALDVDMLLHKACVVPNFKEGDGHFFVNHVVHEAVEHLSQEAHTPEVVE